MAETLGLVMLAQPIGSSISGVDGNSAESIGMSRTPLSWLSTIVIGQVSVGEAEKVRPKGAAGKSDPPISTTVDIPSQYKYALRQLLGPSVDNVQVIANSPVAMAHGRAIAVTRRGAIYLSISGEAFLSDPRTMLEEYYHVIKQWDTGRMTILSYGILSGYAELRGGNSYDDNPFEIEAKDFARKNLSEFQYMRGP
jgi:hypothetical protein